MSNYPEKRPETLEDVLKGHIVGKVTEVNQHNSIWLRDALDITVGLLRDIIVGKQGEKND